MISIIHLWSDGLKYYVLVIACILCFCFLQFQSVELYKLQVTNYKSLLHPASVGGVIVLALCGCVCVSVYPTLVAEWTDIQTRNLALKSSGRILVSR